MFRANNLIAYFKEIVTNFKKFNKSLSEIDKIIAPNFLGKKYNHKLAKRMIQNYGPTQTLKRTDNRKWIAYFPKGDFTIIVNKKTDIIDKVFDGKKGGNIS